MSKRMTVLWQIMAGEISSAIIYNIELQCVDSNLWQMADFSLFSSFFGKNHEKAGKDVGNDIGKEIGKDALSDKGPNKNVLNLINVIGKQQLTLKQMMEAMSFKSPSSFHKTYLDPAIDDGYVTKIYPDKPTHKEQAYSLTEKGLKIWKKSRKK